MLADNFQLTARLSDIPKLLATVKVEGHKNSSATALRAKKRIITSKTIIAIDRSRISVPSSQ